jgi:hypothetical protein
MWWENARIRKPEMVLTCLDDQIKVDQEHFSQDGQWEESTGKHTMCLKTWMHLKTCDVLDPQGRSSKVKSMQKN